ncbi:hypothetical protein WA026_002912 [Henosepilachna vigintioctopunctata]|uniref:Ig-like domain-containing protein n=1 Tax=Henosepilachna vigintioctopunctata TaxID=420089 RepID=A0AAW1TLL6_9CUCU
MVRYKSFLGYILYIWLIIENFISGVRSLKNMHMTVPEAVKLGDTITLSCDYDLESVALYTIKWYRNEEEFYRYVPKESPPSQVYGSIRRNTETCNKIRSWNSRSTLIKEIAAATSSVSWMAGSQFFEASLGAKMRPN